MENKKYLAIIPARGGSKRLPRKNVLPLSGKPLISWTIEAALACDQVDKVVVSSDDSEVLSVAGEYPVELIKRPESLSTDTSSSFDVVKHVIQHYPDYEYIILLQPTSPLRKAWHLKEAIKLLEEKKADAVVSVSETAISPLWSNTLPEDKSLENFLSKKLLEKRSQDLPVYYHLNGAIYICNKEKLLEHGNFFLNKNIYAYEMSKACSVDIDNEIDFKWAEFLVSDKKND